MKISAVKVLEHGQVAATQWPDFFFRFLNAMAPKNDAETPEPGNRYELGETLFAVDGKAGREPILSSATFTSPTTGRGKLERVTVCYTRLRQTCFGIQGHRCSSTALKRARITFGKLSHSIAFSSRRS